MSIAAAQRQAIGSDGFTVADLDDFPEDGLRYELIEGMLLVSAVPILLHQRMCARIYDLLRSACPPELEGLQGPVGVVTGPATLFQPDVVVLRTADVSLARGEAPPPLLVIEVRSPSSRLIDQGTKRLAYREAGIGAYWMADPHEPSVTVIRWDGDTEDERVVVGDDTLRVDWPVPVEILPSALVSDLR